MNSKILAATIALVFCWVSLKLWFAPPKDLIPPPSWSARAWC